MIAALNALVLRELQFHVMSRTQRSEENRKGKENHAPSECQLKLNLTFCEIVPLDKVLNSDSMIAPHCSRFWHQKEHLCIWKQSCIGQGEGRTSRQSHKKRTQQFSQWHVHSCNGTTHHDIWSNENTDYKDDTKSQQKLEQKECRKPKQWQKKQDHKK